MRYCIILVALIIALTVLGQTKDRRAELAIKGGVKEISVSPDEKIWLVSSMGNTYYANYIDSSWHCGVPLFEKADEFSKRNSILERISFFNKDTAIMTGYISKINKKYRNNGFYLTQDAGKSWKLLDFGGDSWIYTIHTDRNGNAWMGGLSKELYYTCNFGRNWTTLKLPYKTSDRTYGIYMINSKSGIASSDHNEIITTEDNWKTVAHLKTPLDQKKYKPLESSGYVDDRISKIIKWNNNIVVNQKGHIFYSAANNIEWKSFPIAIVDFEIDIDSKKLIAVTDSLRIISFSTPTEFQILADKPLSGLPIDIKAVNHSLYIVCQGYEMYKANESGLIHALPYTTDRKIPEPIIVKKFSKLTWGISGNQIYLAEDSQHDWYRENALKFRIADLKLLSDSVAILWDGSTFNYLYSLTDHIPKIYFPSNPIKNFLAAPVKSFSINAGSQGCFHNENNEVRYEATDDSTFTTSSFSVKHYQDKDSSIFKNKVKSNLLSSALVSINTSPYAIPLLKDFLITEMDKKNYLIEVDKRLELESKETDYFSSKQKINKEFYYSVPAMLDTLNNSIITRILNLREGVGSTTSDWFTIQIVNQNCDTINVSRNDYGCSLPWNLPWMYEYKGLYFNCSNIEFSRFIDSCIPENFMHKEAFDNRILIMLIAKLID